MRAAGIHWGAVGAAAVAVYAIGFVIYGLIVPAEWWMSAAGVTEQEIGAVASTRMPLSVLMPIATAFFMAILFKWGSVRGAFTGAKWGAVIALASAVPALWYGWVYGVGPAGLTLLDSGHLLLGHIAAGAVLGGWK